MNDVATNSKISNRLERLADASLFWQRDKKDDLHYEKSLSHHIGARNWEEDKFYAYGEKHVALFQSARRFISPNENERTQKVVEWGPGGGANALAFLKHFGGEYIGIDISKENLDEAARICNDTTCGSFTKCHIDIQNPEAVLEFIQPKSVDLFISTAVFPHLPDKEYAKKVIEIAAVLLKPNAVCMLHVLNSDEIKSTYGDYNKDVHRNTVFTYEETVALISEVGLVNVLCVRDSIATYSYYVATKHA